MRAALVGPVGIANLAIVTLPEPAAGPGEVVVALRAASLNWRDLLIVEGGYGTRQKRSRLIPLSDGAGEVVATGPGVTAWKSGDRVMGCFHPDWQAGPPTAEALASDLGCRTDGVACEFRVFRQDALVRIPDGMGFPEAATLPCAAATAWSAVIERGGVRPGDRVLVQGTGGVSLFALQFAVMTGAEVFAITSGAAKAGLLRRLGARHVVNYRDDADWGRTIRRLAGGRGVTHAVEIGGAGTLRQTMHATAAGGFIAMVGVVSGARAELNIPVMAMNAFRLEGVAVGSRLTLRQLSETMALHGIRPVIDPRAFALDGLRDALEYLRTGTHSGKVCVAFG